MLKHTLRKPEHLRRKGVKAVYKKLAFFKKRAVRRLGSQCEKIVVVAVILPQQLLTAGIKHGGVGKLFPQKGSRHGIAHFLKLLRRYAAAFKQRKHTLHPCCKAAFSACGAVNGQLVFACKNGALQQHHAPGIA